MDKTNIFDLFQTVREHPDFSFGVLFVGGDFPNETVPEDFSTNRACDCLAEHGNEYIEMTVGYFDETDEDELFESDIFELFQAVREHPDYVFGTIFVPGDFPSHKVPEDFSTNRACDYLAEKGSEYISFM